MTRVSDIAVNRLCLCRKPPAAIIQNAGSEKSENISNEFSGSGGGGPGSFRQGIGAALLGIRTLNKNRQLLWFTLLAGLVLAANTIVHAAQYYISWNLHMQAGIVEWRALEYFIEFATLFCLVFLLAGLTLSLSSGKYGHISFSAGLFGAKKFLKEIFLVSVVLAALGMFLNYILFIYPYCFSDWFGFLSFFGHYQSFIFSTLSDFPFNLTLRWDLFTEIPGYGGRSLLFWIYPGLADALLYSAVNLVLLVLTMFVLPLIVLEQRSIGGAVKESFTLIRKTWAETAACIVIPAAFISVIFLIYMPLKAAYGILAPLEVLYYNPSVTWIGIGFFYDLVFLSTVFVAATVWAIAAINLYTPEKSGQMLLSPETKPSE